MYVQRSTVDQQHSKPAPCIFASMRLFPYRTVRNQKQHSIQYIYIYTIQYNTIYNTVYLAWVPCIGVVVSLIFVALILGFFYNLCLRFVLFTD